MASKSGYLHQQMGWPTLLMVLTVAIIIYVAFQSAGVPVVGAIVLLIPIIMAVLFGSMTVQVDREHLRLRFGVGLVRRAWKIKDIQSAEAVRNPWYTGWGIRLLPGVTVYNVSGFDAVEIRLRNGKRYRVGTNDPRGLEGAIRGRIRS